MVELGGSSSMFDDIFLQSMHRQFLLYLKSLGFRDSNINVGDIFKTNLPALYVCVEALAVLFQTKRFTTFASSFM